MMNLFNRKKFFGIVIAFSIVLNAYGQFDYHDALKKEVGKLVGYQAALYNGAKYLGYPNYFKETHPFFKVSTPSSGTIQYDGMEYQGINLLYDEYKDIVVLSDQSRFIELNTEKITAFTLDGDRFINLNKDYLVRGNKQGIYQVVLDGKIKLLCKEIKSKQEKVVNNELIGIFESNKYYFIVLENQLIPITKKQQLFKLFSSEEEGIRKLISREQLKFRGDKGPAYSKVIAYLNNLP